MMLIERHWTSRTQHVRDAYTSLAATLGLGLHTHNRKGEKGFFYIEEGYTTTPEGAAMQDHFRGIRDFETAALFHSSSMEFMRSVGPDPLSLVTEIPLFAMDHSGSDTLVPENYVSFREALPNLRLRLERGDSIQTEIDRYGIRAVPVRDAIQLQLAAIELGIETVEANRE